jgi:DNA-binding MarR family transcriptional regulator
MSSTPAPTSATSANAQAVLQGCTSFRLRQLTRVVSQQYDAELARSGLKTTQYSLLSHVLHLGPTRPGDLARAMRMDASTLTRNLKPLLQAGWLQMEAGEDGRSRLVSLTTAGRERRSQAQRHWKQAQLALNEQLGPQRVAALHALIDDCLMQLGEHHV